MIEFMFILILSVSAYKAIDDWVLNNKPHILLILGIVLGILFTQLPIK